MNNKIKKTAKFVLFVFRLENLDSFLFAQCRHILDLIFASRQKFATKVAFSYFCVSLVLLLFSFRFIRKFCLCRNFDISFQVIFVLIIIIECPWPFYSQPV